MVQRTCTIQRDFENRLSVYLENIQKLKSLIKVRENRKKIEVQLSNLSLQR